MLETLKEQVYMANIELVERGLVIYTWGNVSGIDKSRTYIVIKPSGLSYQKMTPDDMVVVDLYTGKKVEGCWNPSSDTPTHIEIYKAFPCVGGIAHTHSINAVAYAQAGIDVPALGTTHADYFYGPIPCTRELTEKEVTNSYEENTGKVIVECINNRLIDPMAVPGILVKNHGPFSWGKDPASSVYYSVVMETICEMNIKTMTINRHASMKQYILDKHYRRKNGPDAYYGQKM